MKILALQANPDDQTVLRLAHEIREIKQRIFAVVPWGIDLISEGAVRPSDLEALLLFHCPHIVHFSGHGMKRGELVLEDNWGSSQRVPIEILGSIFSKLRDTIQCVVLNSCYSSRQAQVIKKSIPFVIGMKSSVSDRAAIAFSGSFYQALAFGKTITDAFELAKLEIGLLGVGEERAPVIHCNRANPRNKLADGFQPILCAEFELNDRNQPSKDGKAYEVQIFVKNAPSDAQCCVYQYLDEWEDSIKWKHQFVQVPKDTQGFVSERSFWGNVLIRATLWSANGGMALSSHLADALRTHYGKRVPRNVRKALRRIANR